MSGNAFWAIWVDAEFEVHGLSQSFGLVRTKSGTRHTDIDSQETNPTRSHFKNLEISLMLSREWTWGGLVKSGLVRSIADSLSKQVGHSRAGFLSNSSVLVMEAVEEVRWNCSSTSLFPLFISIRSGYPSSIGERKGKNQNTKECQLCTCNDPK